MPDNLKLRTFFYCISDNFLVKKFKYFRKFSCFFLKINPENRNWSGIPGIPIPGFLRLVVTTETREQNLELKKVRRFGYLNTVI